MRSSSSSDNNSVPTLQPHNIGANSRATLFGQLTASNSITLKNTGSVPITCFTSNDVNASAPIDALVLQVEEEQTVFADEISDGNGYSWLILMNTDVAVGGSCEVGKV